MSEITARAFAEAEWRTYRALRLAALADAPEAFGATLAEAEAHRATHWQQRLRGLSPTLDLPLGGWVNGSPAGLAWGKLGLGNEPHAAHLFQMWVAPAHRGLGLGALLLGTVIDWARAQLASHVELSVTCGDTPARRLYAAAGFTPWGDPEPLRPGSQVQAQPMRLALGD